MLAQARQIKVNIKNKCMPNRFSRVQLCAILQTVACQAPLSMEFSREEYWSGLPFPSPGDNEYIKSVN